MAWSIGCLNASWIWPESRWARVNGSPGMLATSSGSKASWSSATRHAVCLAGRHSAGSVGFEAGRWGGRPFARDGQGGTGGFVRLYLWRAGPAAASQTAAGAAWAHPGVALVAWVVVA